MLKNSLYIARLCMIKSNTAKKRFSKIAEYILSNTENINNLTISSIAENTSSAYATVCRFFKEVGVCGLKELKKFISSEMQNQKNFELKIEHYNPDNKDYLSYSDMCKKICDFSSGVVSGCYNVINEQTAQKIANLFSNAGFVYFLGMGTSAVTVLYAHTKMFRLNLNCAFDTDTIISKMKASMMKKGDILFAVSSSGRTKPVIEAAAIAKRNGACVIALCDFVSSPLSELADINLCTTIRDSNKYIDTDFPLIQGQITIIDILYSYIYKKQLSAPNNRSKTATAVIADKLM